MFKLFFIFFKLGLFTFGGGYAMIPLIKETIVNKNKWMTEDEMLEVIAIAESTPGPIAINMATYIGYKQKKLLGGLISTLGVILPSIIIIFSISLFLDEFMQNQYIQYAFTGIKCAVSFLILKAGFSMFIKAKRDSFFNIIFILILSTIIILEITSKSFSSIYLILIGGIIGIIFNNIKKAKENN